MNENEKSVVRGRAHIRPSDSDRWTNSTRAFALLADFVISCLFARNHTSVELISEFSPRFRIDSFIKQNMNGTYPGEVIHAARGSWLRSMVGAFSTWNKIDNNINKLLLLQIQVLRLIRSISKHGKQTYQSSHRTNLAFLNQTFDWLRVCLFTGQKFSISFFFCPRFTFCSHDIA